MSRLNRSLFARSCIHIDDIFGPILWVLFACIPFCMAFGQLLFHFCCSLWYGQISFWFNFWDSSNFDYTRTVSRTHNIMLNSINQMCEFIIGFSIDSFKLNLLTYRKYICNSRLQIFDIFFQKFFFRLCWIYPKNLKYWKKRSNNTNNIIN